MPGGARRPCPDRWPVTCTCTADSGGPAGYGRRPGHGGWPRTGSCSPRPRPSVLGLLEPIVTLSPEGRSVFAPRGRLLGAGDTDAQRRPRRLPARGGPRSGGRVRRAGDRDGGRVGDGRRGRPHDRRRPGRVPALSNACRCVRTTAVGTSGRTRRRLSAAGSWRPAWSGWLPSRLSTGHPSRLSALPGTGGADGATRPGGLARARGGDGGGRSGSR